MQQVIFIAPGKLAWREANEPTLQGANEAIVKPIVVGRCDLDTLYVTGRMPLASGEPIGHEIIAEIVALGDGVSRTFTVGQRVIVSAQICCGACRMCRLRFTGRCEAVVFGASYGMGRAGNYGGGLADLLRVPFADAMLVPIPINADPTKMIGLADMATDAWRAVGPTLAEKRGATVLVLGGATPVIGIYAAGIAVSLGAAVVHYIDTDPQRRERAIAYGAHAFTTLEEAEQREYEIIVDASGSATQLLAALRRAAPEAIVTCVAPAVAGPSFPMQELYMKGVTFNVGRPNCRAGHDGALHAWSACGFNPDLITPNVYSFKEACDAWCDPSLYVAVSRLT
ncbi:MAG: alcohol dehydrogenase catalytic domain-containing protein [Candidatus Obscuribacterales bacterium]|nr:alcohol dehydrogenase catalytic domain-containing protein [Steroidobacteraceae bacterium]